MYSLHICWSAPPAKVGGPVYLMHPFEAYRASGPPLRRKAMGRAWCCAMPERMPVSGPVSAAVPVSIEAGSLWCGESACGTCEGANHSGGSDHAALDIAVV